MHTIIVAAHSGIELRLPKYFHARHARRVRVRRGSDHCDYCVHVHDRLSEGSLRVSVHGQISPWPDSIRNANAASIKNFRACLCG